MKMNVPSVIALSALSILGGCSKTEPTIVGPHNDQNLIVNSTFEINGIPSYQGWSFWSNVLSTPSFSADVPPDGGKWSVVLSVGDRGRASMQTRVAAPVGGNRYKLSLWAKSKGNIGFVELIFNKAIRGRIDVQDSLWRYYEVTDSLGTVRGDSLEVLLDAGTTNVGAQSYFELCRLEKVD